MDARDVLPCPNCGGTNRLGTAHGTTLKTSLKALRRGCRGSRPPVEEISGTEFHRASGEIRWLHREIDRVNDHYGERIVDARGEVVPEVDEPLSAHRGRGSARREPPEPA